MQEGQGLCTCIGTCVSKSHRPLGNSYVSKGWSGSSPFGAAALEPLGPPRLAWGIIAGSGSRCPVTGVKQTSRSRAPTSEFDPNRTCHAHGILAFDCSKIGPGVHQGLAAGSWERTFQMSGLEL